VKVVRAGWTSASFLVYAGALLSLGAAFAWLAVISADHSQGAFAGWTVLFYAVAEACAFRLLARNRPLVAGLFAFVGVGLFGAMVGAFFRWFGWLHTGQGPFSGFHWGVLGLVLLTILAAFSAIRFFHFPLLVAIAAGLGWYFVTDVLSSGGNWSATVTLLVGLAFFVKGLGLDGGASRPYGFWVHVVAGLTVGGALLHFWHSSDTDWALIIVTGLVFMAVGAAARRSSYAVLGAVGLVLATGHYSIGETFGLASGPVSRPTTWAGPVAYLCLGLFLALLGMLLHRRNGSAEPS
jgi:hypothetical protein